MLLAAAAGAFGSLDTALNIAFPDLVADFDLTVGQLQWVVICFVAASGGLLIPAGALGDRAGHAVMVRAGAATSGLAMLGCAVAPSFGWFLGGRVVQGVGTAAVMASAPALATIAAAPERRQRAVGVFQSATAVGLAAGPIIGGVMVLLLGWRGVFWFRVPLALALVGLAMRARPQEDRLGTGTGGQGQLGVRHRRSLRSRQPFALFGEFRPAPKRRADERFPRVRALLRPGVIVANVLTFVANGAMFASWLLVPSLLVDELGLTVTLGGFVLAVSPIATALAATKAGSLDERIRPATMAATGLAIMAGAMVVLAEVGGDGMFGGEANGTAAVAAVAVALGLVGLGLGLFAVPNMASVMGALPDEAQGLAGAVNLMMRTLGIVTGAAWHGRVFDRVEPTAGFGPAFTRVFGIGAAMLALAAVVAAVSRPWRPSSA